LNGPEVITMGRVSVDLYPEQIGVSLAEVKTFAKSLGGSATNVAVAAARLGHRSVVITKVGDDGFGRYVRSALEEFGVDARFVGTDPGLRTPLAFCEIFPPDDFPLLFYREPKAPDSNIEAEELDLGEISSAPLFWITGTGLSEEPSRSATLSALEARSAGITVIDLDYRPMLWESREETERWYREALKHATVVVGNQEEVEVAVGTGDPREASEVLLDLGLELAIVKRGPEGVFARTKEGVAEVPPIEVEIVNGLGAGDAFGGALCHGLLLGWEPERTLRFANAAGAIVASRLACADDMPTRREVEELLERSAGV
jgi:5-dehydro-2-deoxygluconokinase